MNPTREALGPQWVGIAAMLVVIGAALALGTTQPGITGNTTGDSTLAAPWLHDIEAGTDHIEPAELAEMLQQRPADVLLVDVRPPAEYAQWHLPGAHNLSVPDLCGEPGAALLATTPKLVVLYSNGPAHPGQAWVELQRRGLRNVRVLAGGLDAFRAQVLTPPSLRDGASEANCRAIGRDHLRTRMFFLGSAAATTNPARNEGK